MLFPIKLRELLLLHKKNGNKQIKEIILLRFWHSQL